MEHFAWPIAFIAIGFLFMLLFRQQIGVLLTRVTHVGKSGVDLGDQSRQPLDRNVPSPDALLRGPASPVLLEQESVIRRQLTEQKLIADPRGVEFLIRELAATRIALAHEFNYGIVFGSQLEALRHINGSANGLGKDEVRKYYATAAATWPDFYATFSFETWLTFLVGRGLVSEADGRLRASEPGKDFMRYLVTTGRTGNKVL